MAVAEQENPLVEGLERLPVHPTTLVIFGATGDLAHRKLLPAIYNLAHEGALPERFNLIGGLALGDAARGLPRRWRASRSRSTRAASPTSRCSTSCSSTCATCPGTFDDDSVYDELDETLERVRQGGRASSSTALFYLSTRPRSSR